MCVFVARKVSVCDAKAAIQLDMDISTSVWQKHCSDFPTSQMLYLHTNPPDAHAVTYMLLKAVQKCSKILKAFTKSSTIALNKSPKYEEGADTATKALTTMGRHQQELSTSGRLTQDGKGSPEVPLVLFFILTTDPSFF